MTVNANPLSSPTQPLLQPNQNFASNTMLVKFIQYPEMRNLVEGFGKVQINDIDTSVCRNSFA